MIRPSIVLAALLVLTLSACGEEEPAESDSSTTLDIFVIDDGMSPFEGADITAEGEESLLEDVTNEEGHVQLADLDPGDYTVTADAEHHMAVDKSVSIDEGENLEITLQFYLGEEPEIGD